MLNHQKTPSHEAFPNHFLTSFGLHSGQYHFDRLGGDSVKPTHAKWNHSFSHYNETVSMGSVVQ